MRKITPPEKSDGLEVSAVGKTYYPTFYISTDHLPEAKKWEVGKTYDITIRVKQTGFSMRKGRDGKEQGNANFDIVGIEPGGEIKKGAKRYTDE